jgi:hypothetical protein
LIAQAKTWGGKHKQQELSTRILKRTKSCNHVGWADVTGDRNSMDFGGGQKTGFPSSGYSAKPHFCVSPRLQKHKTITTAFSVFICHVK